MNLILIEPDEIAHGSTRVRLNGRRLKHVRDVHRAGTGDRLRVGIVGGKIGVGTVVRLDDEAVELDVELREDPPPGLPLTLLLALPRPKSLKRVLQGVTAMGVKRIFLMNAWRVERSYWQSPLLADAALRAQLVLGLEQARDTQLPAIELKSRFKPFIEDEVPTLAADTVKLVAHPDGGNECPRAVSQPLTLAVGPEGGFIQYEIDLLQAHGFTAVSLGARRLRTEQAIAALLGRMF